MFGPEFRRKKAFHFCATVGGSLVTEKLLAKKNRRIIQPVGVPSNKENIGEVPIVAMLSWRLSPWFTMQGTPAKGTATIIINHLSLFLEPPGIISTIDCCPHEFISMLETLKLWGSQQSNKKFNLPF